MERRVAVRAAISASAPEVVHGRHHQEFTAATAIRRYVILASRLATQLCCATTLPASLGGKAPVGLVSCGHITLQKHRSEPKLLYLLPIFLNVDFSFCTARQTLATVANTTEPDSFHC